MSVEVPPYERGRLVEEVGPDCVLLVLRASELLTIRGVPLVDARGLFDAAEEIRPGGVTLEQVEKVWVGFLGYLGATEPALFTDGATKH